MKKLPNGLKRIDGIPDFCRLTAEQRAVGRKKPCPWQPKEAKSFVDDNIQWRIRRMAEIERARKKDPVFAELVAKAAPVIAAKRVAKQSSQERLMSSKIKILPGAARDKAFPRGQRFYEMVAYVTKHKSASLQDVLKGTSYTMADFRRDIREKKIDIT